MLYHEAVDQFAPGCGTGALGMARSLWQLGVENHRLARAQMAELEIDCDYQREGFHFLARRDAPEASKTLAEYRKDYEILSEDGFAVVWLDAQAAIRRGGSPLYLGGLSYIEDAQFHSGKYVIGVARGVARSGRVRIFEHADVVRIENAGSSAQLVTGRGVVSASHVFLATNALAPQLVPALDAEMRAERGQGFVTESLPQRPCAGNFTTYIAWWRDIPQPGWPLRGCSLAEPGITAEPDRPFSAIRRRGENPPQVEDRGVDADRDPPAPDRRTIQNPISDPVLRPPRLSLGRPAMFHRRPPAGHRGLRPFAPDLHGLRGLQAGAAIPTPMWARKSSPPV